MRVEPSGVFMMGICSVQTHACSAKQLHAITAVHASIGGTQIDVCKPCLDEMVRSGAWKIPGSKVSGMRPRVDIAITDKANRIILIIEAKVNIITKTLPIDDIILSESQKYFEIGVNSYMFATPTSIHLHRFINNQTSETIAIDPKSVFKNLARDLDLENLAPYYEGENLTPDPRMSSLLHANFIILLRRWIKNEQLSNELLPEWLTYQIANCDIKIEHLLP